MPFSELLVNPISRTENSIRSEITLRSKTIRTPFFGAKVVKPVDFEALMLEDEMNFNPQALCFDISTVTRILHERRGEANQLTLKLDRKNPYLDMLLRTAFTAVDPRTEAFYYDLEERQAIMKMPSFPARLKEVFEKSDTDSHNQAWMASKKHHLALIEWYFSVQKKAGADLILPPTPLLTGSNLPEMAKLVWAINTRSRSVTREFSDSYPAFYLPFHYKMLDHRETVDTLANIVEAAASFQRVFAFKVVWYSNVTRSEQRKRLASLLERIDQIKRSHQNGFIVLWLEAGSEGYPLMFNGVDGYFEPINGHVGYAKMARDDSMPNVFGSWLDPRSREMMRWEDLVDFVRGNGGYLPHDCKACDHWHGKLGSSGLDSRRWNLDRRVHHFQTRMEEVQDHLIPAIESNQLREEWLRLVESGDKNHLDLSPARFHPSSHSVA